MADHHDLLDRDTLRELREMLGAGLAPVLSQFGSQAHELLRAMEKQVQSGDAPAVRALAHKLKGSAGSVGARRLATEAARLEKLSAAGELDAVRAHLVSFPTLVDRTVQALHQ
jgi:HPt (histidine-containing phosphotransfer) domain-containing protein